MRAAKNALRREIKKTLASLSSSEKDKQSEIITSKVLFLPAYQHSRRVSVYINMDDEVRTGAIINDIFRSGRSCFIPRYSMNSNHMDMVKIDSLHQLHNLPLTKWNIRQPSDTDDLENALETGGLDIIIVPGLAFTTSGARLGRGRGYYDTFLSRCREIQDTPPVTVALAFAQQILSHVPTEDTDILLDCVMFPDKD